MPNAALQEQVYDAPQEWTDLSVGEILRRTRVHYERSVQDVENTLRIRAEQLEALETGDVSLLPAPVYAIGFVRSYAEYLGLDGDKMVKLFKAQSHNNVTQPKLDFPKATKDSQSPPLWLLGICCVLIATSAYIFTNNGESAKNQQVENSVPEVPAHLKPGTIQTRNEEPKVDIPKQPIALTLEVIEDTSITVQNKSGKILVTKPLKAGEKYALPNRDGLFVTADNFEALRVLLNDEMTNLPPGITQIPLDGQKIQAMLNETLAPSVQTP